MNAVIPNYAYLEANLEALLDEISENRKRIVAVFNAKGGVGKTTLTSNLSAALAHLYQQQLTDAPDAERVLVMDLESQGDVSRDLGIKQHPDHDGGRSIVATLMGVSGLSVIKNVRPGLDVITGGEELQNAGSLLANMNEQQKMLATFRFVRALAALARDYAWVLIDCPPKEPEIQALAVTASRWLLLPTVFDSASQGGLEGVSDVFKKVGAANPDKELLGVVLFGFDRADERYDASSGGTKEVGQRRRVRQLMQRIIQKIPSAAPVYQTAISNARVVAEVSRKKGMTAAEVADAAADPAFNKKQRAANEAEVGVTSAEALAADYQNLAVEIVTDALKREAAFEARLMEHAND